MEWAVWVFWRVDARWTLSGGAGCSSRPGGDYGDDDDKEEEKEEVGGNDDKDERCSTLGFFFCTNKGLRSRFVYVDKKDI